MSIRRVLIGTEKRPVLVVDNLFRNAESLVDFAARTGQFQLAPGYYPGVRCPAPANYGSLFFEILSAHIEDCFQIRKEQFRYIDSFFSMVTTPRQQLSVAQQIPHFDKPNENDLAVVHYLCDSRHGGTAFYKHRQTGYEFVDHARSETYMQTLDAQLRQNPLNESNYINKSSELFEQTALFEAVFNRAIIYPCNSLHSGAIPENYSFDVNPATGRLTVTSFIY